MFNSPTPILFSLSFFTFYLRMSNQARLECKQVRLFIFIFFSYPPKKMITAIQVYKKDPETGKMYMWRYIDWLDVHQRPQELQRGIVMKPWCTERHTSTAIAVRGTSILQKNPNVVYARTQW
jgi:hypothetical protein